MGSCWGTSPYADYAARLAEMNDLKYAPPPIAVSNVASVNLPYSAASVPMAPPPAPVLPPQAPVYQ